MGEPSINLMSNFGLQYPYKLMIYLSSIIFVLSLFVPINGYELNMIQLKSLQILGWGLISWFIISTLTNLGSKYHKEDDIDSENLMYVFMMITQGLYIFISLLILR